MQYIILDSKNAITTSGEILSDPRSDGSARPWVAYKLNALQLSSIFRDLGKDSRSSRVHECGTFLNFLECSVDSSHPKRLSRANFCRDRLCPTCGWRRSLLLSHTVYKVAHYVSQDRFTRFLLLTLTVKNCLGDVLSTTLDKMFKAFSALTHKKKGLFTGAVHGWFRSLEVTYNAESGTFHPHFHVLLAVGSDYFKGKYIKQSAIVDAWAHALDIDYTPVVDIRTVQSKDGTVSGLQSVAAEVAKYAVKPMLDKLSHDTLLETIGTLSSALHGRRLVAFGGTLKDANKLLKCADVDSDSVDLVAVGDDEESTCHCSVCQSDLHDHLYMWVGKNYVG